MKDHFHVAKKLYREKLTGIFFIPSAPYRNKKILDVHLSQLILGKVGGKIALTELLKYIEEKKLSKFLNLNEKKIFSSRYSTHRDIEETKKFKKIINYYFDIKKRKKILKYLTKKFKINFKFSDIYLTISEIKKMHKMGMIIGSHADTHVPLSRLRYKDQYTEINTSKNFVEKIINKKCDHYCHPYGRKSSYNKTTLDILKSLNFNFGYSVEDRDTNVKDFKKKFELPRFDCNNFI